MKPWLVAVFVMGLVVPAHADMQVQTGAPAGFETLEAPRPTIVTLRYGGDVLGPAAAHFSPGRISFDAPAAILDKLPAVIDKPKVGAALAQPMETHPDRLCTLKLIQDCGSLSPEIVGVIFDEDMLTAELFINPAYLAVVDQNAAHYLPLPAQDFSTVAGFTGAINGANGTAPNYTLGNDTVFSLGEAELTTETTAQQNGLRFDTAAASVDRNGWTAAGGLFRSHPMQLLTDRDIVGASYSTSMRTRLDSQKTRGNDVIVYLPRRSYVSIYREGRLYSSQAYEAGNQRIDTSELPDGAYEITLRIQDSDGETHDEKRFFAKTQDIPPPGQPTYYVDAGLIRKPATVQSTLPEVTSKPILRAGTVERVSDNVGLDFSVLGVQDRALAETGATWLAHDMKLSAAALTSTRGDLGVQTSFLQTMGDFNASVDVRKTWLVKNPIPGFEDQSDNTTQLSTTMNYSLTTDLSLGIRASYSRENDQLSTSIGPYTEWRLWGEGDATLGLTVAAAHTDHQNEGSALLHFSYNFGDYNVSGAGGISHDDHRTGPVGNLRVMHTDTTPGNALTLGGGVSTGNRQQVASGDADWQNSFGQLRGSVQQAFGQSSSAFGYGGSFSFNATQLADEVDVGGNQIGKSAVIVEVAGDAAAPMRIFVNNVESTTIATGGRQIIYLVPYHSYDIRLAPAKPSLFDYDNASRRVTLYPGNVVKLHWDVNKFYVVSARIVTSDNKPLVDAVLKESRAQVITDQSGRMQAELSAPRTLTFNSGATSCTVALPLDVKPVNGVLLYKQPLSCAPATGEAAR